MHKKKLLGCKLDDRAKYNPAYRLVWLNYNILGTSVSIPMQDTLYIHLFYKLFII